MTRPSLLSMMIILLAACTRQEHTEEINILAKEVAYEGDGITMKGYLSRPAEKGSYPGVLVVHEWWGHNEYARTRADKLAEMGYVALAVDMYGDGKTAEHPQDAQKFAMSVMGNIDGATERFAKALESLKSDPNVDKDQIAAIGYCFGGSVVLTMAAQGIDLDGVAAFHSGVQLPVKPSKESMKAAVLVCNGADDPFVPAEQIQSFKALMDELGADYKYVDYEGAVHGFTNPGADSLGKKFELPLAYNAEADQKSWNELEMFFQKIFE